MGVGSSPKEYIKAVADGFAQMSVISLRKFGSSEKLKELLLYIATFEREFRAEIIPEEDFEATRKKHFRLGNLRKARMVIQNFAKSHRLPI